MEIPHSKRNSLLQINFLFGKFVSISLLNEKIYETLPILYLFINMLTNIIYGHPQRRCACYCFGGRGIKLIGINALNAASFLNEQRYYAWNTITLQGNSKKSNVYMPSLYYWWVNLGCNHKLQSGTRLTVFGTKTHSSRHFWKGLNCSYVAVCQK